MITPATGVQSAASREGTTSAWGASSCAVARPVGVGSHTMASTPRAEKLRTRFFPQAPQPMTATLLCCTTVVPHGMFYVLLRITTSRTETQGKTCPLRLSRRFRWKYSHPFPFRHHVVYTAVHTQPPFPMLRTWLESIGEGERSPVYGVGCYPGKPKPTDYYC